MQTNVLPATGDPTHVLTQAVLRAAAKLGLSKRELAEVIGISASQVTKLGSGASRLQVKTKQFELAAHLVRLFRSLDAIVGGDEKTAKSWMRNPNDALGSRPADHIKTVAGLLDAVAYLDQRRAPA